MKKLLVLPVVLLVLTGLVLTGCPTEAEPHNPLDDADFVLTADGENGAQYEYEIVGCTLTKDKEYEAILTVTEVDERLVNGHIAGQVAYKDSRTLADDGEEPSDWIEWKTVGSWTNATPDTIVAGAKTYKWTFTVSESTPSSDHVKQVFQITAQDSNWEGTGFPAGSTPFGIKGSITFQEKAPVSYGAPQIITVDTSISGGDSATGKGNIQDEEFTKVANAAAGSILRFHITCTLNNTESGPQPGWGIGAVGNGEAPAPITVPEGEGFGTNKQFTVDVEVSAALETLANPTDNWLFVNIWSGAITKVELLEPVE
ncbi:MAG: hypothetical protein LBB78_06240 [Spirochaetaceae bacterium]|jgi:hypothetical protein|nr:hypothetical protein [Spirochaetaceae bacterium]